MLKWALLGQPLTSHYFMNQSFSSKTESFIMFCYMQYLKMESEFLVFNQHSTLIVKDEIWYSFSLGGLIFIGKLWLFPLREC